MAASDRVAVIDAFEAWVRSTCDADDQARFNRSIVEGFVAFTSDGKVEPVHVDQGIRFAREASVPDLPSVERIGALLLAFTRGEAPSAAEAVSEPPAPESSDAPFLIDLEAPPAEPLADVPEAPGPELTIRISPSSPSRDAVGAEPREVTASSRARVASRTLIAGALVGVAVTGALVAVARFGREPTSPPTANPGPALRRLDGIALAGDIPAEWREAPGALLYVGTDPRNPEHAALFALTPSDPDVEASARSAERAMAIRYESGRVDYESIGCGTITLGATNTGVCSGMAGDTLVTIYVRRVGARDAVAMFFATTESPAAQATARTIVASLRSLEP